MTLVPSRELRNKTREVLMRAEAGEEIAITVDGRPVASLVPLRGRRRWMPRDEFLQLFEGAQADPGLARELKELVPDTTDEL
jgi:prevent-host-death family protein